MRIQNSLEDRIFHFFVYVLLSAALILVLYPLYFVVIASFSDPNAVNAGRTLLLPSGLSVTSYRMLLGEKRIWLGYRNTIFYTAMGTLLALAVTMPAGYALSRRDMPFRNGIMRFFVFTMFFGGGLIPTYMVVRDIGLLNGPFTLVVIGSVSVYNIIVSRTFFQTTIPADLQDAASIDGCNNTRFFLSVVLPLSKAIIAVIALFVAVGHWNQYFNALIYLTSPKLYPLQMIIRDILLSSQMAAGDMSIDPKELEAMRKASETLKYSIIIVSSLPMLAAYPFLQRYFVKGVMLGSLKG